MSASSARKAPEPQKKPSKGSPRFEVVVPPRQPKDRISYRKAGPGVVDPVKNAETQLGFLSEEFRGWLKKDRTELLASWQELKQAPLDSARFLRFHKSVHIILGNAAILECSMASALAAPLARLLERAPDIEQQAELIDAAVMTINSTIEEQLPDDDPRLAAIIEGLETIVDRWITRNGSGGR